MTTAIILAGGRGTRLRAVVADRPKPMAPILGRPFLEHLMDYWIGQGVARFVLSLGYMAEYIEDHFGAQYRGVPLGYAVEPEPLGTGGGLLLAMQGLDDCVLVLNGDTFFEVELAALRAFHERAASRWTFALHRHADTDRYLGMQLDADGRIVGLRAADQRGALVNGGVYLLAPQELRGLGLSCGQRCSLEDELLPRFVAAGHRACGLECAGRFIDIGIPLDYQRAGGLLGGSPGPGGEGADAGLESST